MQKIKNESGITLIALTITIIVALILAGVSAYTGYSSIKESESQRDEADLEIVHQAIVAQYAKAAKLDILNTKIGEKEQPEVWKGTIITDINSITNKIDWGISSFEYYEDYYYRLSEKDLAELGITNTKDDYIVNYKTGEVYNETEKTTPFGKTLYIKPIIVDNSSTQIIDTTFSDDEN